MKSAIIHLITGAITLCLIACANQQVVLPSTEEAVAKKVHPKLVVGLIVDQMRYEYLMRFADDFGEGGFKRLLDEGYLYANAHYHYTPTNTAPGHASVYTGATPHRHGIVGNYWYHRGLGQSIYCTQDDSVRIIGGEGRGMSPHRMKTTTITDELELATLDASKVIGISIKDRGAILPAGHMGDAAYWMARDGRFVTSSYYMEQLPQWVEDFNGLKLPQQYIAAGWQPEGDEDFIESLPDDNPYESRLGGKDKPVMPYDLTTFVKNGGLSSVRTTPHGNTIVRRMGEAAITGETMGRDAVTDFLCLSFSSTDYIGHAMGPRSREVHDTYLKLDQEIAQLLNYLDMEIGKDAYLVFLTADHGADEVPAHLHDMGFPAKTVQSQYFGDLLDVWSEKRYGQSIIANEAYGHVHLAHEVIASLGLDVQEVVGDVKNRLLSEDIVHQVYTREEILRGHPQDEVLSMIFRGYDAKQNGDLIVLLEPGCMTYKNTGTAHGSPYNYDTHIPVLWYGAEIPHGRSHRFVHPTAIAGTLSHLLGIAMPETAEKDLMEEVLR